MREKSAFEILKNEVKQFLTEYNISMYTNDNSVLNYELMRLCFKLDVNYNFDLDPLHKKRRMLKSSTRST
jgi:hypothetical protein